MLHVSQLEMLCPIGAYPPRNLNETTNETGQIYNLIELQQIVYLYGALLSTIPSGQSIPQPPPTPRSASDNDDSAQGKYLPSATCLVEHWSIINLIASSPNPPGPYPFFFFLTGASIFGLAGFLWITQLPTQFPLYVFIPLSNVSGISCIY
ncbi:hypothetical protein [Anaerocolumna xylanovorans]|uniref:Uncharacterized protein n=1 Tax=Anaerocolumna xylanovorans DSM 12503 TaxID=1121345 RepID=A0A1M7YFI2_9FIRM|nr:hypothetical protein [Anaerocolumna xylanovorans]SHO51380.1 hypothetical protein SAMN02745217_03158 [Anaerocolumna xylanovorans DSM 12503]